MPSGAPPEQLWPYDITRFSRKPSAKVYKAAEKHRAKAYFGIPGVEE